jgi:hypothetical protein
MMEIKMAEILTPKSPRWDEFADGIHWMMTQGCDEGEWRCDGDSGEHVHRYAKTMMRNMGNVDIEDTLAYCKENGGYCDCEILFNVDRNREADNVH